MTLSLQLTEAEELALAHKAQAAGVDVTVYAAELLRREIRRTPRTLDQLTHDIDARRGGPLDMSEDQIAEMLETAKHQMRADRRRTA